jgi:hypothetical protein
MDNIQNQSVVKKKVGMIIPTILMVVIGVAVAGAAVFFWLVHLLGFGYPPLVAPFYVPLIAFALYFIGVYFLTHEKYWPAFLLAISGFLLVLLMILV